MSEFKGTKGKWSACCQKNRPHFLFSNDKVICGFYKEQEMSEDLSLEEVQSNAKLIACAPEMLEMLEDIFEAFKGNNFEISANEIEQLIKKATS